MKVDVGIWSKLTRMTMVLLVVAGILAVGVILFRSYVPVIQQNERIRKEVLRLDTQIQKEEEMAKQLNSAVHSLSTDPKTVERLARERLGYAKPGETVVRFETASTNAVAQ